MKRSYGFTLRTTFLLGMLVSASAGAEEFSYPIRTLKDLEARKVTRPETSPLRVSERGLQTFSVQALLPQLVSLIEEKISQDFQMTLDPQSRKALFKARDLSDLKIDALNVDKERNRFYGEVRNAAAPQRIVKLRGKIILLVEIPVLKRQIRLDETIQETDLTWEKIPARRINASLITEPEQLIGKKPRARVLFAGVPLKTTDVKKPRDIERNSLVTVTLETPQIFIQDKGRALENGYRGDIINVRNLGSGSIIQGRVIGQGRVQIETAHSQVTVQPTHEKRK